MLILYSTLGCHLCSEAVETLLAAGVFREEIHIVDIVEDLDLMDKYSTKIPVVQDEDSQLEICWPFCVADVTAWWNSLP